MLDRVTRFIFRNTDISALRPAEVSGGAIESRMTHVAIVRVDDMTRGASRRTIISGMIVRAEIVQRRIEQPRLLQTEINRVGALRSSQSARAQAFVRLARIFVFVRQADFQTSLAATLEHAQDISRLRNFPARHWIEKRQDSFQFFLFIGWLRNLNETLRRAGLAVAFTEVRVLERKAAVVVKRSAPKHRAVRHHALCDAAGLCTVAVRTAAGLPGHAQV